MISEIFTSTESLLAGVIKYVSENLPSLQNVTEFLSVHWQKERIRKMVIQASAVYSYIDMLKLGQYIEYLKIVFNVQSEFRILSNVRSLIANEGDLSNTESSLTFSIPIIDLSINIVSEESVYEYVKIK